MKKTIVLLGLLVVCLGISVTAQPAKGQHNGLWVGMYNSAAPTNHVLTLDPKNVATAYTTKPNSAWPYWGNPFGACMYSDNQHVLIPVIMDPAITSFGLVTWDNNLPGAAQVLWQGPILGGPIVNWSDWTMNSDGEILTIDNDTTTKTLQTAKFLDPSTKKWRSINLPATTRTSAGILGTKWDRLNGGFVWGAWGPPTELYRSNHDFSTTQTLATGPLTTTLGKYGGDLVENGDFYSSTCCTQVYYVVKAGTSTFTPGPVAALNVAYDITTEHMAKPGIGLWTTIENPPRGIQYIDPMTTPPTVTKLYTGSATTMPRPAIEVVELYNNDLCTRRTGPRIWDVNINPGNGLHAGKSFVMVVSLAGTTKISLPDGRELFITPDNATVLSQTGQLAPFLTGNVGKLDASGKARAVLDLNLLGTVANGNVIHMAAVVFDTKAPSGIAHVCQPWAFVINNK